MFYVIAFGLVYKMVTLKNMQGKGGVKGFKRHQKLMFHHLIMKRDCFRMNERKDADNSDYPKNTPFFGVITKYSVVMAVAIVSYWIA